MARGVVEGSIPGDLAREEHARIDEELDAAERILETSELIHSKIEDTLDRALELLGRCDEVYRLGGPKIRRLSNQFFFEKLLVVDDEVAGAVLAEPWATLLAEDLFEEEEDEQKNRDPVSVGHGSRMTKLAGPPGLEPGLPGPEPGVLPIALRPIDLVTSTNVAALLSLGSSGATEPAPN